MLGSAVSRRMLQHPCKPPKWTSLVISKQVATNADCLPRAGRSASHTKTMVSTAMQGALMWLPRLVRVRRGVNAYSYHSQCRGSGAPTGRCTANRSGTAPRTRRLRKGLSPRSAQQRSCWSTSGMCVLPTMYWRLVAAPDKPSGFMALGLGFLTLIL